MEYENCLTAGMVNTTRQDNNMTMYAVAVVIAIVLLYFIFMRESAVGGNIRQSAGASRVWRDPIERQMPATSVGGNRDILYGVRVAPGAADRLARMRK
jgi:hypothetical protein